MRQCQMSQRLMISRSHICIKCICTQNTFLFCVLCCHANINRTSISFYMRLFHFQMVTFLSQKCQKYCHCALLSRCTFYTQIIPNCIKDLLCKLFICLHQNVLNKILLLVSLSFLLVHPKAATVFSRTLTFEYLFGEYSSSIVKYKMYRHCNNEKDRYVITNQINNDNNGWNNASKILFIYPQYMN